MLKYEDISPPFTSELVEIDGLPVVVPILGVKFGETALQLHWWNSTVLLFDNQRLNHVEYTAPKEPKKGIRMHPDMMGLMREMLYPTYYRPLPDDSTVGGYAKLDMAELETELDEL